MKYAKPEVVLSGSALAAIQSTSKGVFDDPDANPPHEIDSTVSAYEADE
jgi:hypothetical protein